MVFVKHHQEKYAKGKAYLFIINIRTAVFVVESFPWPPNAKLISVNKIRPEDSTNR
jgi:hypothetical protein